MSWRLELLEGDAAIASLRDAAADGSWERLAATDPRPTWFQEPAFVLAWYAAYAGHVEPLVAIGRLEGRPIGLLALARAAGGELVHAGDNHAWYQGWIAEPQHDGAFIAAAADAVLRHTRARQWTWKHLPRGFDAAWTDCLRAGGALVSERAAPVWDLTTPDAIERHLKPRLRNYINRYRRAGELRLERVRDQEALHALHVVAPWYELRHGAVRADLPFRDDARKLPFHELLASAGDAVHTSVLRFGDRPLAVHMGGWDGHCLSIGLFGFDPMESRQSPGNILMLELAAEVRQLGGGEIDLTPGGEGWKDGFASHHETVYRVELSASAARQRVRRLGHGATALARGLLGRIGVSPQDLRRVAAPLLGRGDMVAPALRVFELDVAADASTLEEALSGHAPPPAWLEHLLAIDSVCTRDTTTATLSLAMRLLHRGWTPLLDGRRSAPATMLWQPPADSTVFVATTSVAEPVTAVRTGAPEPDGLRVPEGVPFLLVGWDDGDPDALVDLIATRAAGVSRVWLGATRLSEAGERFLRENARPILTSRVAA